MPQSSFDLVMAAALSFLYDRRERQSQFSSLSRCCHTGKDSLLLETSTAEDRWRPLAVTFREPRLRTSRRLSVDGEFERSNSRVDRSARSSVDVNLESYTRARSRER